jgi:hypothetical protein
MVPVHQSGTIAMPLLTENQLTDIVDMIVDDYGSRLTGGEVSEVIGQILENTSGFETVDSQTLTQTINEIRKRYDFRYDVRAHTERGLRNRVISVRKCLSKDSTLDW